MMGVSDPPRDASLQAPMEDPPISASLGPIDRLICRLRSLEGSKHTLPVGLRVNQIGKLREHLERFRKPLKNLSEMEETSFRAKWWMKEVREFCYDTEDYLVQSSAGVRPLGRIARIIIRWMHGMLKWRSRLSKFMARAEVLKKTCEEIIGTEIQTAISLKKDRKAVNSHEKENKVDTETLPAQLVHMLAFEDDKQPQLKVVIISGLAGSGKTTLARTLYVDCKKKFQCSAFVRVSRNPDFRSLLTSILSQIKALSPQGFCDVQGLMCSISDHLQGKRYFIAIDDVRSPSVWDIISGTFPGGNFGSRIIVTTQSEQVEAAYSGYKLKSAIFKMGATDDGCTHTSTKEKSKVLNTRYNNLPLHLKTCLLYFSMYPEGCTVTKDDLAKQWVGEGFVAALKRHCREEISDVPLDKTEEMSEVSQDERGEIAKGPQDERGEIVVVSQDQTEETSEVPQKETEKLAHGYFDELVARGMIQPVDRNHKGEVLSCTVHHMVLDLIRNKSKEDNFVVVLDNLESTLGHPDIVRRLSVQFGCEKGASIPESIILSQVRSLTFYGFVECVPFIADYGLLRVLNLHIWADEDKIFDLTRIGELSHLIYLKIECNITVRLPLKIRRLQHLGTLELHAEVESIPSDIGHLKKLLHVRCPSNTDVRDLGDLTSLLDFHLTCSTVENLEYNMKCLRSILEKLTSLRCLALVPASGSCSVNTLPANPSTMCIACDSLCIVSPVPVNLQRLELPRRCCVFSRVPMWIGELHKLCILKIAVRELSTEDIDILKGMPALTALSLHVELSTKERIVFGKEGFSVLTNFKFMCTVPWLKFEDDAMPNLEKLKLCFNSQIVDEQGTTGIIVIEHLLGLKEISAIIGTAGGHSGSAWRKAIRNDPRNPKVQLMGSIYYGDQRRGMVTHQGSGEDENNEADIRVHTQLESSRLPVPDQPKDQPFISTLISISNESETMDGHTGQVVMHGKRPGGSGHSDSGGGLSQGGGGAHGGGGSLGTHGEVNPEAAPHEPLRGEGSGEDENNEADIRIHKQPESSRLPVPARCKEEEPEDRPSVSEIISIPSESESTDGHTSQIMMHGSQLSVLSAAEIPHAPDAFGLARLGSTPPAVDVQVSGSGASQVTGMAAGSTGAWPGASSSGTAQVLHPRSNQLRRMGDANLLECVHDGDLAKEMVGGVVSVVTGVMNPLIGKLIVLAGDECKKLKGVRKQASFLVKEFSAMNAALHKLELVDELDPAVKDWRDHVREMSYDMENCIDDFMREFGREDAEAGFVKRTARRLKKLRRRHRIAARMEELKSLAIDANARRERYKIDDWKPSSGLVTIDPRLRAVYQEGASLVGIDGPTEELASWLMDTQNKLKVLSIVGFGGLGKTTLAKQLYDKIRGQFCCEAFFSISQKPDIKALLNRLEAKLDMTQSSHAREVEDIIQDIREHLKNKRYLIVVDDLWDQSLWNIISRAFPNEGNGSRVIVTTRVEDVASTACHINHDCIYRMKPLNEHNSRMLFFNRIFGSADGYPSYLEDISADILKKCGGLPLAIITIASLLASQEGSRGGWENIRSSLGVRSTINPTLEDVKSILNLSYMHLPLHLRACFLYLGMYSENEEIEMSVVIREWVAEGLVSNIHGLDLMDVGKSYFNELINRSMIQTETNYGGEMKYCRVQDLMLDLILSKCAEDNFLSVASSSEDITRLQGCKYKVRRLSLRSMAGGATNGLTIGASLLSQVRSCAWARNSMPPLLLFKYLRVLTIHSDSKDLTIDLTAINQLFQLRYLTVICRGGIELPCALKGLVYLETLDLDCRLGNSFPSDIIHLPRLSYLRLPYDAPAIQGVENMKSLRALLRFDLDKNLVDDIRGLGELTNLRELELFGGNVETSKIDALASSVGKLRNLKYLDTGFLVVIDESNRLGLLPSSPFKHIEQLELWRWEFPRVPKWMGDLHCLRVLYLSVTEMSAEDVHVLGKLPSLVWLNFRITKIAAERAVFGKGVFPILETFQFFPNEGGDVTAFLVFEEGAMPKLRTLSLKVTEWGGSTPVGMEHLTLLEKIHLRVYPDDKSSWTRDDVASAFRKAAQLHPNRPSVSTY